MTRQAYDNPQFYLTAPTDCPYLPDRKERKVFTHLVGPNAPALNDVLTQGGFRRSQNIAYRPACEDCRACVSIRVCAQEFQWTKSLKRVWKDNQDLIGTELPPGPSTEQYDLFHEYLSARHTNGGMTEMSPTDYSMMVEDTHVETALIEYRRRGPNTFISGEGEGPLIGVALTDRLCDGLSMVYSFFDHNETTRSLGTYMILEHIARAQHLGLPYVYLGYWVQGSPKMTYKERFKPQEHLGAQGWEKQK
ncbi:putative arginyl-tRNA--protein transferase [Pseudovibrio sp. Ad13]|uniref:arginyltransferase n=1 Tax=unclassified Pseudovibrio TaxID=2627060 RepID=UPI0007AEA8F4|nr:MULTISPECIES: arginyltransferase [unclassified Pseudovibrio]KZK82287.1 putative arginyl-tRNA--protein transferase [Pseudovibrio sp. Ad13]KZL18206.1 putative arginyl-tRNA--protein transferase [Pseudovibrio sp. Ad37]